MALSRVILGSIFIMFVSGMNTSLLALEYSGNVSLQGRYFPEQGDFGQQKDQLSLALEPEIYHDFSSGHSLTFVPFARYDDADDERTHWDIRELNYFIPANTWELRVGVGKVFWGVTESQHLVDVINQTDLVDSPDGEDKLGQPMVHLGLIRDWGLLDLYVLPGFRERTFPGKDGRFRTPLVVDTTQAIYESDKQEDHVDFAARWSHSVSAWDIGLSYFDGTSRDPNFVAGVDDQGNDVLIPVYNQIQQTGLDLQATLESWLLKFEGIHREGADDSYYALTTGFEYTFYGVMDGRADLGIVAEYLYDDRDEQASTPFADDIFLGFRLAFTDVQSTEALFGFIRDNDTGSLVTSIEASRRLGNQYKLSLEARQFSDIDDADLLKSSANDDFVQLELQYFF